MKKKSYLFIIILVSVLLPLLAGEALLRLYHVYKFGMHNPVSPITLDDRLGWIATKDFKLRGENVDAAGRRYVVNVNQNSEGFRLFGNRKVKDKKKVLFIGDSFTQAVQVSDNKTYYGLLKDALPIEVFAYGAGGYGNLQEYLILDRYVDVIQPDAVVWQLCSNDFINNHYELEYESRRNNNGMMRPYLTIKGEMIYAVPSRMPLTRQFVNRYSHSQLLYFLLSRIDILASLKGRSVEDTIKEQGKEFPPFNDAVTITDRLFEMIRTRIPEKTMLLAFCADDAEPYFDEMKRLALKNGMTFIEGVPGEVRKAEHRGVTTRTADGSHWNEAGHQIVADVLRDYLFKVLQWPHVPQSK